MKKLIFISFLILLTGSSVFSQVGINTNGSQPDVSAGLDVKFSDKGLLIPQITLLGADDATTVPTPATSLLVYNTATNGTGPNSILPGFYYNSGTPAYPVWKRLSTDPNFTADGTSKGLIITLSNAVVTFGQDIPVGTLLIDVSTSKEYLALAPLPATANILESQYFYKVKEISNATHTGGDVNGTPDSDVLTIGGDKVLTGMIKDGEVQTSDIKDNSVTYAKMQDMATQTLLGNNSGSLGTPSEIQIGTGLQFNGSTLQANGITRFTFAANNGVTGVVTNPTSTPELTLTLGTITPLGVSTTNNIRTAKQFVSTLADGIAPLVVTSTTQVANLFATKAVTATSAATAANISGSDVGILYQSGVPDVTDRLPEGTVDYVLTSMGAGVAPEWRYTPKLSTIQDLTDSGGGIYNLDATIGVNARLTLTQNSTIRITGPSAGASGYITVVPGAHTLRLDASGIAVGGEVMFASDIKFTAPPTVDLLVKTGTTKAVYHWYYDGLDIYFDGNLNYYH
jgi:hypothetical protein